MRQDSRRSAVGCSLLYHNLLAMPINISKADHCYAVHRISLQQSQVGQQQVTDTEVREAWGCNEGKKKQGLASCFSIHNLESWLGVSIVP